MFQLDHVIIAVLELNSAAEDYRALGFTVNYGGRHASGTTHNALICFSDGTYLELLAPTGDPPLPGMPDFNLLLQHGEGLVGYALLAHDLEADSTALRVRGADVGEVKDGRRQRTDGIELHWRTANIDGGKSPFLIQDVTPRNLRVPDDRAATTHSNGVTGIAKLEGSDLSGLHGNHRLISLILVAPSLHAFDSARTHNVTLTAI
ncbi:MAG: VOC family protein [Chloroflexota bacterium]